MTRPLSPSELAHWQRCGKPIPACSACANIAQLIAHHVHRVPVAAGR